MTWNIRFGHKEDWRGWIEMTINRSRFRSQFGNLDLEDLTNFDCVVPLQLADYAALQNKNNEGFLGQKFWSPNPNVVDLCDDKLVLNRFCSAANSPNSCHHCGRATTAIFHTSLKSDVIRGDKIVLLFGTLKTNGRWLRLFSRPSIFAKLTFPEPRNLPCTCY